MSDYIDKLNNEIKELESIFSNIKNNIVELRCKGVKYYNPQYVSTIIRRRFKYCREPEFSDNLILSEFEFKNDYITEDIDYNELFNKSNNLNLHKYEFEHIYDWENITTTELFDLSEEAKEIRLKIINLKKELIINKNKKNKIIRREKVIKDKSNIKRHKKTKDKNNNNVRQKGKFGGMFSELEVY